MRIFIIVPLFLTFLSMSSAQVSLAPEWGVYYRPFTLGGVNSFRDVRESEMYVGLLGEVKLTQKIFMQTRVSYIFKNNYSVTTDLVALPEYRGSTLYHEEMNFDLWLLYNIFNNFKLGLGHGFAHKLGTHIVGDQTHFTFTHYLKTPILNYLAFNLDYSIGRLGFMARYHYIYKPEFFDSSFIRFFEEKNAFSVGVYYKFFGGKDGSKKR